MSQRPSTPKQILFVSIALSLSLGGSLLCFEIYARTVLAYQEYRYFEIMPNQMPFFRLKQNHDEKYITIRNHRRELAERGLRELEISFVGDSVTFGSGVSNENIPTEIIQNNQNIYDIYNHGVEGYGFPEIKATITNLVNAPNIPEEIIYTFVYNDPYPAMAGNLWLLSNDKNRFSTIEDFQGIYGKLKLFAKDYFKSFFVIKGMIKSLFEDSESNDLIQKNLKNIGIDKCIADYDVIKKISMNRSAQTNYKTWDKQYRDAHFIQRLKNYFTDLKQLTDETGVKLSVLIHYDFLTLEREKTSRHIINALPKIISDAEINLIPTFDLYANHYQECDFYFDGGHLGKRGSALLADHLTNYIMDQSKSNLEE